MKPVTHKLGPLQLKILKELWARGEATVAEIHESVGANEDLAYTTIATMLRKMEARGLVGHKTEGRVFIYKSLVNEAEVSGTMTSDLVDRLFAGSVANLLSHLLRTRDISKAEINHLEELINEKKGKKK